MPEKGLGGQTSVPPAIGTLAFTIVRSGEQPAAADFPQAATQSSPRLNRPAFAGGSHL